MLCCPGRLASVDFGKVLATLERYLEIKRLR